MTVTTNDESGSTTGTGVFQPLGRLMPSDGFSSVRFSVEVLSTTGGGEFELAARTSNDGITWGQYLGMKELGLDEFSSEGWHHFPWIPAGVLPRFVQFGVFAKKKTTGSPVVAQAAVLRCVVDFKPIELGGGS